MTTEQKTRPAAALTLNAKQREAACAPEGPVLIIGGSGTGRSHTIKARVIALLSDDVKPTNISVLTLSSRNAERLLSGIQEQVEDSNRLKGLFVGTFHQYASSFLKQTGAKILGIPRSYTLWDNDQALEALIQLTQDEESNLKIGTDELNKILHWHKYNIALWGEQPLPAEQDHWPQVIKQYQDEKNRQAVLDMDDLIPLTIQAMELDPKTRNIWSGIRTRHLLVDDFQDMSNGQYRLLCLLVNRKTQSITIAADPNQNIYGWRGANPRLVDRFRLDFPSHKTFFLRVNHRNTETLVEAAQALTDHPDMTGLINTYQRALRPPGPEPELIVCEGPPEKLYAYAADAASKLRQELGMEWEDIAFIYRRSRVAGPMSNQLLSRNIPYTVLGETKNPDQGETRRTIALLNLIVNPNDLSNFITAASVENGDKQRGLNKSAAAEIKETSERENVHLIRAAELTLPKIRKGVRTRNNLEYVIRAWKLVNEIAQDDDADLELICKEAEEICRRERQKRFTAGIVTPSASRLLALSRTSVRMQGETCRQHLNRFTESLKTAHFADHQGMDNEDPYQHRKGAALSTIHSAKGLQWKAVWILDAADHVLPGKYVSEDEKDTLEEAQRLFYVATTRATDRLFYCFDVQDSRGFDAAPTRFLEPLDHLIKSARI